MITDPSGKKRSRGKRAETVERRVADRGAAGEFAVAESEPIVHDDYAEMSKRE